MSAATGPVAVIPRDGFGPMLPGVAETSAATQGLVDQEVRRIIETAHEEVTHLLTEHRDQLDSLTRALLGAETLDALDAYTAARLPERISDAPRGPELVTSWHHDHAAHHAA